MFNLPWYAWFNLLALPVAGLLYWFHAVLADWPHWSRQLLLLPVVGAAFVIVFYWNPALLGQGRLLPNALFLTVAGGVAVNVIGTLLPLLTPRPEPRAARAPGGLPTEAATRVIHEASRPASLLDIDDVDLDAIEGSEAREREQVDALISLLFRRGDAAGKARQFATLVGIDAATAAENAAPAVIADCFVELGVTLAVFGGPLIAGGRLAGHW